MRRRIFELTLLTIATLLLTIHSGTATNAKADWKLVWQDEFNQPKGSPFDNTKWTAETGGKGWGNNELQYYTTRIDNAFLGWLTNNQSPQRRRYTGNDNLTREYTSARLITKNRLAQPMVGLKRASSFLIVRDLTAFWLLGDDIDKVSWPRCSGSTSWRALARATIIHGTIHGPGYSGHAGPSSSYVLPNNRSFADSFHAVIGETKCRAFPCDDVLYKTMTPADLPAGKSWVFDRPFFILLNLAVGGNWPGNPDGTTVFPQTMLVDYVRVYQRTSTQNRAMTSIR